MHPLESKAPDLRKSCTKCKLTKTLSEFAFTKTTRAYSSECKMCLRKRQHEYNKRPEVRARRLRPFGYACNDNAKAQFDLLHFHSSYMIVGGCWEWRGSFCDDGYGRITCKLTGERIRAHRFSYLLHYGPFKKTLLVCHKCDNPKCVNPAHLFLGTHKDNLIDASIKGRLKGKRVCIGSEHTNAKLNDDKVIEIRKRLADGESISTLGREYRVSPQTIFCIRRNKTWRHLLRETGVDRDGSGELEAV